MKDKETRLKVLKVAKGLAKVEEMKDEKVDWWFKSIWKGITNVRTDITNSRVASRLKSKNVLLILQQQLFSSVQSLRIQEEPILLRIIHPIV